MMTIEEIQIILDALRAKYGAGYADDPAVARLQVKLSIMLEAKHKASAL